MTFAQRVGTSAPLQIVLAYNWIFGYRTVAVIARERTRCTDGATALRMEATVGNFSTASRDFITNAQCRADGLNNN